MVEEVLITNNMAATLLQQVHSDMLKDAVPMIQALCKEKGDNISEDDIRDQFHAAFCKHPHINLEYAQERFNKTDMVIQEKDKSTGKSSPVILYELKTYFKEHEVLRNKIGEIISDIDKLYKRKSEAKAYFILVCRKSQIDNCPDTEEFKFIKETGLDKKGLNTRYTVKGYFDKITIAVKHRELNDDFVILSWQVERKPTPKKKK